MTQQPMPGAEKVFAGARFDVFALQRPTRSGASERREVVVPSDAVVILPLLDDGRVVLIRNERFAVGQTLWELPAGTLEAGEEPAGCAARELREETGYDAAGVEAMLSFYMSPGFCTEQMHAFRATGLSFVGQQLDETERIEAEVVAIDDVLAMIHDGRIVDAKTVAVVLYHLQFGKGAADVAAGRVAAKVVGVRAEGADR
ncbi:MAG: NUDIX hydrolase [Phycisphaeraceae bacterium]